MDSNICRVCLNKGATVSLFEGEDSNQHYLKIMRCTRVTISKGDGFPSTICSACEYELLISYGFVLKCEASDNNLRSYDLTQTVSDSTALAPKLETDIKEDPDCFDDGNIDLAFKSDCEETSSPGSPKQKRKKIKSSPSKRRRRKRKVGPIPCPMCGLLANSKSAMDIHLRIHTGERPFCCSHCDSRFPSKGALGRHIETFHEQRERKFICETCGKGFFRKNDVIIHMRRHTGERPYTCPFCSKSFQQSSSWIRHKRTHTGEKPYECHICHKNFIDKSMMNKHMVVHTDEKKFTCHLCEKPMKTKHALRVHLKLHSNEKTNICNFCGMAFSVKGNLKMHIKRIHSEKSGQCSVCFKTVSDLELHLRSHTGERPFPCNMCDRAYISKRSLSMHIQFKHENASKYKCTIENCLKTFPTSAMLEFHLLKQHTNHTPYVCQYCSKGFFRGSDLSRHIRVSHADQLNPNELVISNSVKLELRSALV